jgi:hypothetical protein
MMERRSMPRRLSHNGLVALRLRCHSPRAVYAGLLWVREHRGHKAGWAAHKFRGIFGKWPRPQSRVEPAAPSNDLIEWLGIERKRYGAQRRRRREG